MAPAASHIDLELQLQAPYQRTLLRAGGVWDKRLRKYKGPTQEPVALHLMPSQVEAGELLARWCLDYEADAPRVGLVNCVDERRGGKTYFIVGSMLLLALRYPTSHLGKTVVWIVVPTFPQQREIHETLAAILPAAWYRDGRIRYFKSANFYRLANGAEIWIKSADRPATLKWGSVFAVGVNEAQQVDVRGILNILGANIDGGGLTVTAMNPPDSTKGLWAEDLHDAIIALDDKGKPLIDFACEVKFPAARNPAINQKGRTRFLQLAKVLDPKQARRDGLGEWIKLRNVAYPQYNRNQHYRPGFHPEFFGWTDVTVHVNALTGFLNRGEARTFGSGMDWQHRPYCAWVEGKVYVAPAGTWVPQGTHVYVIRQEVMNDISSGQYWDEDLLCVRVAERLEKESRSPRDYLLIGDATGHIQGASGAQRGRESDPDDWSWSLVQKHGWEPHAPIEERKMIVERGKPTDMKITYSNPRTAVRIDLMNQLFRKLRILILCPETAEGFRLCGLKGRKPWGRGAHLTDAASYLIFAWERALRLAGVVKVDEEEADEAA